MNVDKSQVLAAFLNSDRSFEEGLYSNPDIYDIFYSRDAEFRKPLKLIEENVDSGSKILYVGCGTGLMLGKLEEEYEVIGVDISPKIVEKARERCSSEILCSDVRELDLGREFDAIISFGQGLNYLIKQDLREVLESVKELLKPGGFLIFDSFSEAYSGHIDTRKYEIRSFGVELDEEVKESEGEWFELGLRYKITDESGASFELSDNHKVRLYRKEELREVLLELGYESVEVDNFYDSIKFLRVIATVS
jgi:Cyclopropane fatty acid synthase and related methyltransferases